MINNLEANLLALRQAKPLILSLTNYVTMDFMANILLALGASPIMAEEFSEMEELVKLSSAVNINIGTLTEKFIEKAEFVSILAKKYNKPIILDPVGAGCTKIRTEAARKLLPFADIIRGNASEIMAIFDSNCQTLGVETTQKVSDAIHAAKEIALNHHKVVIISGAEDFITDGKRHQTLNFGSPMMPLITGMGCSLTAVVAAFSAVIPDAFEAAKSAAIYFSLAGQIAENNAKAPGSFKTVFIDNIYQPNWLVMKKLYVRK